MKHGGGSIMLLRYFFQHFQGVEEMVDRDQWRGSPGQKYMNGSSRREIRGNFQHNALEVTARSPR